MGIQLSPNGWAPALALLLEHATVWRLWAGFFDGPKGHLWILITIAQTKASQFTATDRSENQASVGAVYVQAHGDTTHDGSSRILRHRDHRL